MLIGAPLHRIFEADGSSCRVLEFWWLRTNELHPRAFCNCKPCVPQFQARAGLASASRSRSCRCGQGTAFCCPSQRRPRQSSSHSSQNGWCQHILIFPRYRSTPGTEVGRALGKVRKLRKLHNDVGGYGWLTGLLRECRS